MEIVLNNDICILYEMLVPCKYDFLNLSLSFVKNIQKAKVYMRIKLSFLVILSKKFVLKFCILSLINIS